MDSNALSAAVSNGLGTAKTVSNPPTKVVLVVNVGYGVVNTVDSHTRKETFTSWATIGLDADTSILYTARDVFSQQTLSSNSSGFVVKVSRFNATLVLISATSALEASTVATVHSQQ
jgi:hypothetical protein